MIASKMKLNPDKTAFILVSTKINNNENFFLEIFPKKLLDQDVTPTDSARNVGVEFDKDFNLKKHKLYQIPADHATIIPDLRRLSRCTLTYKVLHNCHNFSQ